MLTRTASLFSAALLTIAACAVAPPAAQAASASLLAGTPPVLPEAWSYHSGAISEGSDAGYLSARSQVTPAGEYNYSLPIDVPAGRNDMQPELALEYRSRGPVGLMGPGWSIRGFSEIRRCNKTLGADQTVSGIRYAASDKFCLDGVKLVKVDFGQYGSIGSEYRTELDSFRKITSAGGSREEGPDSFTVWTSEGRKLTYSAVSAARIEASQSGNIELGDVRFVWLLKQDEDRYGNTIAYEYSVTPASANSGFQYRPHRILYTGHTNGTVSRRYVEFTYDQLLDADRNTVWHNGVGVDRSGLLKSIDIYAPNPTATTLVWRYTLGYSASAATGRSLLTSVQKCGSRGGCLAARTFGWEPAVTQTPRWISRTIGEPMSNVKRIDVVAGSLGVTKASSAIVQWKDTADRVETFRLDAEKSQPNVITALNTRQNITSSDDFSEEDALAGLSFVDIDGDGGNELVTVRQRLLGPAPPCGGRPHCYAPPEYYVPVKVCSTAVLSAKPGLTSVFSQLEATDYAQCYLNAVSWSMLIPVHRRIYADIDGDGLPERISSTPVLGAEPDPNKWGYPDRQNLSSNLSVFNPRVGYYEHSDIDQVCGLAFVDLNGDGKREVIGHRLVDWNYGPACSPKVTVAGDSSLAGFTLSDTDGGADHECEDSHGTPFTPECDYIGASKFPTPASLFGDFNGDGLADALVQEPLDRPIDIKTKQFDSIRFNTGNGFLPKQSVVLTNGGSFVRYTPGDESRGIHVVDVNGDGRDDLIQFSWNRTFAVDDAHDDAAWTASGGDILVFYSVGDGRFTRESLGRDPGGRENAVCESLERIGDICRSRGWSASTVGDFNGDGRVDILRAVPSGEKFQLELLEQRADTIDKITSVKDGGATYAIEAIAYSPHWGDRHDPVTSECSAPTRCIRSGFDVVKSLAISTQAIDRTTPAARDIYFDYRNPIADRHGRGVLGFEEFRIWERDVPRETIYRYADFGARVVRDNRESYPYAFRPTSITVVTPIVTEAQIQQGTSAKARVVHKEIAYKVHYPGHTYGGAFPTDPLGYEFTVPDTVISQEWEQEVSLVWSTPVASIHNPKALHVYGYTTPPPIQVKVQKIVNETYTYDNYGNLTQRFVGIADGTKTWYTNVFNNDAANWLIRRNTRSTVKVEEDNPAVPSVTRRLDRDYDAKGRVDKLYIEKAGGDTLKSTTTYYYDDVFGNLKGVIRETPSATVKQETRYEYAVSVSGAPDERVHVSQIWSPFAVAAERPSTWIMTHPAYGETLRTQDANGVQTETRYDDLGREIYAMEDAGQPLFTAYKPRTNPGGGINGVHVEHKFGTALTTGAIDASASVRHTYNGAGASVNVYRRGFDGAAVNIAYDYDKLGRMHRRSRPFVSSASDYYVYTRDSLGRLTLLENPDGSRREFVNSMFMTTLHDEEENTSRVEYDKDGRLRKSVNVIDLANVSVNYSYAPFDLVRETSDGSGTVSRSTYDVLGRRIKHEDPNAGTVSFTYDGFGQLRKQVRGATESAANTETYLWDNLGRVSEVNGPDGRNTYDWDSTAYGVGKLFEATSGDGVTVRYSYDAKGRKSSSTHSEGGTSYVIDYGYNAKSQLESISYPSVTGRARFKVKNTYNPQHYLEEIGDDSQAPYAPLYRVTGRNADLRLTGATLGANLIALSNTFESLTGRLDLQQATRVSTGARLQDLNYDYYRNGLVMRRFDLTELRRESYAYDGAARLTSWARRSIHPERDARYAYDGAGNMTHVFEAEALVERYCLGMGDGSVPYGVASVRATESCAGPAALSYEYDGRGRQISGDGRTLTYSFLDLPKTVTKGGVTWNYKYDAFGNRMKRSSSSGSSVVYIGGLYEKRASASAEKHVFNVLGAEGRVAQVVFDNALLTDKSQVEFTLNDQLGTTTAVVDGTGADSGSVISRLHYEPFGKRIAANGSPFSGSAQNLAEGLTGHEYEDGLGLVNMKGRIYDPRMRRFLSVDPLIADVYSQAQNPFAYVHNSPLNHVDPSGFNINVCASPNGDFYWDGFACTRGPADPQYYVSLVAGAPGGNYIAGWGNGGGGEYGGGGARGAGHGTGFMIGTRSGTGDGGGGAGGAGGGDGEGGAGGGDGSDADPNVIEIWQRPADLPGGGIGDLVGLRHMWVRMPARGLEAGQGTRGGGVPGMQDQPVGNPVITSINDHTGQYKQPNASLMARVWVKDPDKVAKAMELGKPAGLWTPAPPINDCNSVALDIVNAGGVVQAVDPQGNDVSVYWLTPMHSISGSLADFITY